jgi:transcription-repair coupling factor (superfamily II helicase)
MMIAAAVASVQHPLLVVENDRNHADELAADLANVLPVSSVFAYPVEDVLTVEAAVTSLDARNDRINALNFLMQDEPGVVITSMAGLRRLLPDVTTWQNAQLRVDATTELDPAKVAEQLVAMGYRRDNLVNAPGMFAIRGGIIDVYPLDADQPVRIELFDTEVDSIRSFDADTQRSQDMLDAVTITPANDLLADAQAMRDAAVRIRAAQKQAELNATDEDQREGIKAFVQSAERVSAELDDGIMPADIAAWTGALFPDKHTIMAYLPEGAVVFFDEYARILDSDAGALQEFASAATNPQVAVQPAMRTVQEIERSDKHAHVFLAMFQKGMGNLKLNSLTNVQTRSVQQFFSQMPMLKVEADRWAKQGQTVIALIQETVREPKVLSTLRDFDINARLSVDNELVPGQFQIMHGNLQSGFELPEERVVVLTEHDLFNARQVRKVRHQTLANAERLKSYNELHVGDYVVHVNHGIGVYRGIQTLEVDGVHQDYITIEYKDNGQLFIPVTQLNLVQKYVASEGKKPTINKLGGSEWQKTKKRVAAKIEDIADDLIELYAAREAEKGYAFPADDGLQHDFEAEFPYAETPDQVRSVKEIKHDMERDRPMDRLLVGDVGFGKTEVALRAAFKAIDAGKQVALLVPTTILAQQHYETMQSRFGDFPVTVGMLSRFQTAAQNKATIAGLKNGTVDIVVGTHRLLSKDVAYNDLGLLIIDEEQRFGVKHKERIKQLRKSVDVLTLTATPIPRTLNMSMLGVRDLSVIETPPTNRYPIQTFVMEQNALTVRSAIQRELDRGGQVFYLHNRVEDIERTVANLEQLVPEARVVYVHGQMSEVQLETVISDFLHGEADVLVTTTIIETGVDMPNVNTLIIEDADRYGLSQLYQLRGRVGRSSRLAYAYFMYRPGKVLTEVAEKRLSAIRDFTELGSGFKIAMRDLSIRGAGNLLGAQQHGFIDSVGHDLYTQMLQEAVAKRQGHKATIKTDAEVNLDVEAYLPTDYISDPRQKVEIYKRVRQIENTEQETELQDDLIDRFGDYPETVATLLTVAKIKRLADSALVDSIKRSDRKLIIRLSKRATRKAAGEPIFEALSKTKLRATVTTNEDHLVVSLLIEKQMAEYTWLEQLEHFISALADLQLGAATK